MDWNEDSIGRLRALWAEGLSTAEIGRRLNVSKNAVVGKAHRLSLPARPSPIRRLQDGSASVRRPPPPQPALPSFAPPAATPPVEMPAERAAASVDPRDAPLPRAVEPAPRPAPRPVLRPVPSPVLSGPAGRVSACCWPIGEPGTRQFRFCDAQSAPGKPYCAEHVAVAYVKVRDRREEAA